MFDTVRICVRKSRILQMSFLETIDGFRFVYIGYGSIHISFEFLYSLKIEASDYINFDNLCEKKFRRNNFGEQTFGTLLSSRKKTLSNECFQQYYYQFVRLRKMSQKWLTMTLFDRLIFLFCFFTNCKKDKIRNLSVNFVVI